MFWGRRSCFGADTAVLGQTQPRDCGSAPLSPQPWGLTGNSHPASPQGDAVADTGDQHRAGGDRNNRGISWRRATGITSHLDAQAGTQVLGLPLICCRTLASDCTLGLCLCDPWAAGSTHNPGVIWGPGLASEELQVTAAPKSQLCDPLWAATQPRLSAELSTAAGTAQDHRARLESPGQHWQAGLIPLS